MPTAEILSYTLHTGRLGELGMEKLIVVQHRRHANDGEHVVGASEIYFADRYALSGYSVSGREGHARAHLPEGEYAHWVDLLRYEDPVYLHWDITEADPDPDGIVHLSTGPEPPGEGPVDVSP